MPCYEFNYTSNQPQVLPNVWVPCPSGDNCCIGLDTCLSNNICHDYGAMKPRDGSFSSYYNARCTDPTYTSPACDKICIGAPPDIVYNYTSKRWACCGRDGSGLVSCNSPIIGEYYEAPAPANLTTLSAGAVFVSSATLTPDAVNHPTTYSFTIGSVSTSSSIGSSSSSSSSTSATSSSSLVSTTPKPSTALSTSSSASPSPTSSTRLSTGAKAGIGIGVAIGVILAIALAASFFYANEGSVVRIQQDSILWKWPTLHRTLTPMRKILIQDHQSSYTVQNCILLKDRTRSRTSHPIHSHSSHLSDLMHSRSNRL